MTITQRDELWHAYVDHLMTHPERTAAENVPVDVAELVALLRACPADGVAWFLNELDLRWGIPFSLSAAMIAVASI